MGVLPAELRDIFDDIEQKVLPLADYDVAAAVHTVIGKRKASGETVAPEMQAEAMAFDFCEDYPDEKTGWGTYYGPQTVVPREGGRTEWPSIKAVTPAMLAYWEGRAAEAKHPVLKARYADLVWDLSPKVKGERAGIQVVQCAIEAYAEAVANGLYEPRNYAKARANRALTLALGTKDVPRTQQVCDAILKLDAAAAPDENGAGIAFDLFIDGNRKLQLPEATLERIIRGQENILARGVKNAEEEAGLPFSVDRAADRLASYYRRRNEHPEVVRVLGLCARAWIAMAKRAAPMLGAAWLRNVYTKLTDFGCPDEAETVAVQLRDLSKQSMDQMVEYTHTVEIPRKAVDDLTDAILIGTLPEVLSRLVWQFIPDADHAEEQVKASAEAAPLMSLLSITDVDADGREVAKVGSVDEDLDGRVVQQLGQNLQYESQILHHVMQELPKRHRIDADILLGELMKSPVFQVERKLTLKRGLEACLSGDHVAAAHLLIPQIEHAIRVLAVDAGSSGYKPNRRQGGIHLMTLGDLLEDAAIVRVLETRLTTYLKVMLTDPRGWNLRNHLCHGIINPDELGWWSTDRILHILLLLGLVRADQQY